MISWKEYQIAGGSSNAVRYLIAGLAMIAVVGLVFLASDFLFIPNAGVLYLLVVIAAGLWFGTGPASLAGAISLAAVTLGYSSTDPNLGSFASRLVIISAATVAGVVLTQLVRREHEALRKSEQRWVTTLKSIGDAVIATDAAGVITFMNPVAEQLTGWPLGEAAAKPVKKVFQIVNEHTRREVDDPVTKVLEEGMIVGLANHTALVRRDGTEVSIDDSGAPIGDDGKITGVVLVFRDISERKRVEAERERLLEEVRHSDEQLRAMADSIPQLVWMAQPDGFIFWYNRRWYEYTGTTPEQMEGWGWQSVHDPEMLSAVLERWRASIATGEPFEMEFPLRGADRQFRWFLTRVIPLKDAAGKVIHWFGTNTDISYRKEAEAERERLLEEVQRHAAELALANKELEAFTYSVAHDLRSPVRHMGGFSKALAEHYAGKLDERGQKYLQYVREGSVKLGQIIDDLLALTGVTRHELNRAKVDLSQMVQEIAQGLQKEQPERKVDFIITPGLVVNGDSGLLQIVLDNLLGNAWKFTSKQGEARIEFGVEQRAGKTVYYVKDNGAGFDMAYADKLFRAFERLHSENEFPGTGVGLATVDRIIRRHGGEVWAEGIVDKGATFCFTLL